MKQYGSSLFPIGMLMTLAALTFWLDRATQIEDSTPAIKRHDPDYYVDNFTVRRFDPKGLLQHTLKAEHMVHFADDDSTEVKQPDLTFHKDRPARITSDRAWLDSGGKTVIFMDNVVVVQRNRLDPPTEIRSPTLTVLPDDEIARTPDPVVITQGLSVIHGRGLESNNKTRLATLGGRVNGVIESKAK